MSLPIKQRHPVVELGWGGGLKEKEGRQKAKEIELDALKSFPPFFHANGDAPHVEM